MLALGIVLPTPDQPRSTPAGSARKARRRLVVLGAAVLVAALAALSTVLAGGPGPAHEVLPRALALLQRPTLKPVPYAGGGVPIAKSTEEPATASVATGGVSATLHAIAGPPSPPSRLVIPALGVNAEVEPVADDAQGHMAAPSRPERVGWYRPGAIPGDSGNAVLDGHLDWTNGPAVFWRLANLKNGDQVIVVRQDGTHVRFVVDSSVVFPFDARPQGLFTRVGPPSIALVTCSGPWDRQRITYVDRLVVHASLALPTAPELPGDEGG